MGYEKGLYQDIWTIFFVSLLFFGHFGFCFCSKKKKLKGAKKSSSPNFLQKFKRGGQARKIFLLVPLWVWAMEFIRRSITTMKFCTGEGGMFLPRTRTRFARSVRGRRLVPSC